MSKHAIFIHGVRAGTIEFNNTEYGRELKELLKENECSIQPLAEPLKISHYTVGGISAEMVRQIIGNYEENQR